jgi:hypothetical protein
VLDLRRATLQAQLEQVVAELQRAALDATAGEDALRELVVVELQAVERVGLVELVGLVGDRQGSDPRAFAARSCATRDDRSRERRRPTGLCVGSDVEAPDWCPLGRVRLRVGSKEALRLRSTIFRGTLQTGLRRRFLSSSSQRSRPI